MAQFSAAARSAAPGPGSGFIRQFPAPPSVSSSMVKGGVLALFSTSVLSDTARSRRWGSYLRVRVSRTVPVACTIEFAPQLAGLLAQGLVALHVEAERNAASGRGGPRR